MSWLWSILALPILATVAVIAWQAFSGRAEEQRKLRREGAEVIVPVKELVNGLGPEGIMFGTDEQVAGHLNACFNKWWNEGMRERLMVYLNHHPSNRVRKIGDEFATSVAVCLATTRAHFLARKTATDMDDYHAAQKAKENALAKADELLGEIRRRSPGWLRRPKRPARAPAPS